MICRVSVYLIKNAVRESAAATNHNIAVVLGFVVCSGMRKSVSHLPPSASSHHSLAHAPVEREQDDHDGSDPPPVESRAGLVRHPSQTINAVKAEEEGEKRNGEAEDNAHDHRHLARAQIRNLAAKALIRWSGSVTRRADNSPVGCRFVT